MEASFAAADELGADVYEMCVNSLPSWTKVGVPTVGKAKGTLAAVKAADLIVCFHVPLFTAWLKEVLTGGSRVLMIIDGPDELEQLMSPPGLKEAVVYAHQRLARTREARVLSEGGTDLRYQCGEYPVMSQYGFADERGHFDHGVRVMCIPSRMKDQPMARWSCSRAISSSYPTVGMSKTRCDLRFMMAHHQH